MTTHLIMYTLSDTHTHTDMNTHTDMCAHIHTHTHTRTHTQHTMIMLSFLPLAVLASTLYVVAMVTLVLVSMCTFSDAYRSGG